MRPVFFRHSSTSAFSSDETCRRQRYSSSSRTKWQRVRSPLSPMLAAPYSANSASALAASGRPVTVLVFGSFGRGEAERSSDLDVVFVRPAAVDEEEPKWRAGVRWVEHARLLTGNRVEVLEVSEREVAQLLRSQKQCGSTSSARRRRPWPRDR
jgi:hypothetical protein